MNTAYIALGANLGDPEAALRWAIERLGTLGTVAAVSSFYRTKPVGGPPGQPDYLNGALILHTGLEPLPLLRGLLALESEYGRVRLERWGARVLDLDLIAYDNFVLDTPELTLPHPRAWERLFVLEPLAEIALQYRHPVTGETVQSAKNRLNG